MVTELCQSCYFNVLKSSSQTNFILAKHGIIGTTWLAVIEDGTKHRQTRGALLNARRFGGFAGAGKHLGFASIHSHLHYLCPRGTKFTEGLFSEQSTFFAPRARPGNFFAHRTINYKLQNKRRRVCIVWLSRDCSLVPRVSHLTAPGDGNMRDPLRRQRHRGPMIIAWLARDLSPQQVHTGQESSMQNRRGNATIWSKRF